MGLIAMATSARVLWWTALALVVLCLNANNENDEVVNLDAGRGPESLVQRALAATAAERAQKARSAAEVKPQQAAARSGGWKLFPHWLWGKSKQAADGTARQH